MLRRRCSWIALAVIFALGFTAYVIKERNLKYHPYKTALFGALTGNDFASATRMKRTSKLLRREYSFLADAPSEHARVLSLIEHIDANIGARESWTVRAVDIVRLGGAACEVHALAVAVLEACVGCERAGALSIRSGAEHQRSRVLSKVR